MTQFFRLINIDVDARVRMRLAKQVPTEQPDHQDVGILLRMIGMDLRTVPFEGHLSVEDLFTMRRDAHYTYRCVTEGGRLLNVFDTEVQPVTTDYVRYTTLPIDRAVDPRD